MILFRQRFRFFAEFWAFPTRRILAWEQRRETGRGTKFVELDTNTFERLAIALEQV
jgi:hypothetical protein